MKKIITLLVSFSFIFALFSCNDVMSDGDFSNSLATVRFSTGELATSSRLVVPLYTGYDKSRITDVSLQGSLYNTSTDIYDLQIEKSFDSLNALENDVISLTPGKWNFIVHAKQADLPDIYDSVFVSINANQDNLVVITLKNYDQYNLQYSVYVPVEYTISQVFAWVWDGSNSYSTFATTPTTVSDGDYAGTRKYVVKLDVKPGSYMLRLQFYAGAKIIGYYFDTVIVAENNLTEGNAVVTTLESVANSTKITLNYPVDPESEIQTWNSVYVNVANGARYYFPSECNISGYAVAGWYLTSDYSDTVFSNKVINSATENVYYAKCVPIGLESVGISRSYIFNKPFSTDTTSYTVFCTDDNSETSLILSPTLLNAQKSYISATTYTLDKIEGSSVAITVTSNVNTKISRTYIFTYAKKNTVAYYAAVVPNYAEGTYTIKPYYSATENDYKNLIAAIYENAKITVSLDLTSVSGIETIPYCFSTGSSFDITNIKSLLLPNDVKKVGQKAFYNWSGLTSILLPDSLIEIESSVFDSASNLRGDLYISKNLKTIAPGALNGPRFDTLSIDSENPVFTEEDGLLLSKDKTKAIALVGQTEFEESDRIIPFSVTTIGYYCFAYTQVDYINIPATVVSLEGNAFYYCPNLKAITLPYSITTLGQYSFGYCPSLIYADLSQTAITKIDDALFMGDGLLGEVVLPEGILSLGQSAFSQCSSLHSVTIPKTVTEIGQYAFYGCQTLQTMNFTGIQERWAEIDKGQYWKYGVPATEVVCSDGEVAL